MPPFAVTQAGEGCLSARLFVCLPLSYFDRLTHACVDIQRCPLATPTRARYVNCQASKGSGRGNVEGGQTPGNRAQKSNKQMANTKGDGFILLFCFFCACAGQGNCHLPSLHVLNLSFDLRPQLCRLLYRQYTHTRTHTCE